MQEKSLFLQYADVISQGKWASFLETQPFATVAGELEALCHAALLSRNSFQAVEFLQALLYHATLNSLTPEKVALLKSTLQRAEAVKEAGGWQKITEKQQEKALHPTFPIGTFPPVIEEYLDLSLIHISEPTRPY